MKLAFGELHTAHGGNESWSILGLLDVISNHLINNFINHVPMSYSNHQKILIHVHISVTCLFDKN